MKWLKRISWKAFIIGLIIVVIIGDRFYFYKTIHETDKQVELVAKLKEDNGLYFVVSYKVNGAIGHYILCDSVRQNNDKKEVVVREWQTGEYYIFSYPVSITDVTYTKDYIKFTNSK